MNRLDDDAQISDVKKKLSSSCHELGWGWGGVWYSEVEAVLSSCKSLDELGVDGVFEEAVRLVKCNNYEHSADKLIRYTEAYIKNVQSGKIPDLDGNYFPNSNVDYLNNILENFNKFA